MSACCMQELCATFYVYTLVFMADTQVRSFPLTQKLRLKVVDTSPESHTVSMGKAGV